MTAIVRNVVARIPDCEGAYYLLVRTLFASGQFQEVAVVAERAIEASGNDYNIYVPILNALDALGKTEASKNIRQRALQVIEAHLHKVPEDARARILLGCYYAMEAREEDALRETNLAMQLRPNDPMVLYNAACIFSTIQKKPEALDALSKAWRAGFRDPDWVRRDTSLSLLHGDPEFEKLYPAKPTAS